MNKKPTTTERTNKARAAAALAAVRAFSQTPYGEALTGPSLLTQNIADLLADMAHLCDRESLDFADLLRRARNSYRVESAAHPQEFRYTHRAAVQTVVGVTRAARVAETLTRASLWFTAEPMPGDQWEFAVTAETLSELIAIIGRVPLQPSDQDTHAHAKAMRTAGAAVTVFSADELRGAAARDVEDAMVRAANELIPADGDQDDDQAEDLPGWPA